jgi:hypothetical protein
LRIADCGLLEDDWARSADALRLAANRTIGRDVFM